jgi:hypothetical protein
VKAIPIDHGKASTHAPVVPPARRVRGAIRATKNSHHGRRRASEQNSTKRDGVISDRGWKRAFDEPIPLPRGGELVTLEDAGNYITKLPKAEHEAPEWQAAMEALILVATKGGPTMLARIGMMRALSRHQQQRTKPAAEGDQKV